MSAVTTVVTVSDRGEMYQSMNYYWKEWAPLLPKIENQIQVAAEDYGRGRERRDVPVVMLRLKNYRRSNLP